MLAARTRHERRHPQVGKHLRPRKNDYDDASASADKHYDDRQFVECIRTLNVTADYLVSSPLFGT